MRFLLASSNPHKLLEYQDLASASSSGATQIELAALPEFASLPSFEESAPTFAENAAGKALHYSRFAQDAVMADDSGLCVDALGGAPGVLSARYARNVGAGLQTGPPGDGSRVYPGITRLLDELRAAGAVRPEQRRARFVCVLALAQQGRALAVVSDCAQGVILEAPRGAAGFGYDPLFLFEPLARTFAQLSREEKNQHSHRGKAFRRLCELCAHSLPLL
jgi:XTP/dITP diphosphohydrolase